MNNEQRKDPGGGYEPALILEGLSSVQWLAIYKKQDIIITLKWYLNNLTEHVYFGN